MKKIVSIDDEPLMLQCLQKALEHEGYSIFVTNDADEGIKYIKENEDVVLLMLDIKMPGKNGFEIYNEVRQFRKIPVLFVTAYPKSFTAKSEELTKMWQNEFAEGSTDIIYKPFDLATLFEKVEGLIGKPDNKKE